MSDHKQEKDDRGISNKISGLGQKIIGEIETVAGALTADPITQAEGEFNMEVGTVREDLEEDLGSDGVADRSDDLAGSTRTE